MTIFVTGHMIDRWTGGYTIPAISTQVFTFWSRIINPPGTRAYDNQYFNVSIAPKFDGENTVITPLVEVKRERASGAFWDPVTEDILGLQPFLFLTLQNDNDFPVTFLAVHVAIV
jgi:hypothetical protein